MEKYAKVVAAKELARLFLHSYSYRFSEHFVNDAKMFSVRSFEGEFVDHESHVLVAWVLRIGG